MNWKLLLLFVGLAAFVSCGGGPKGDAEKLCDCGKEIIQLLNDKAPEADIQAKSDECDKMYDEFKDKYKDDKDKKKEFKDALDACSDELESEFEAAEKKYDEAMDN